MKHALPFLLLPLICGCPSSFFDVPVSAPDAPPADLQGDPAAGFDPGRPGPLAVASLALAPDLPGENQAEVLVLGPGEGPTTLSLNGAPYPLVMMVPEQHVLADLYRRHAANLASHGLLVALVTLQAQWDHGAYLKGLRDTLAWLLAPSGPGADALAGRADAGRIGLCGHGLGGKMALLVASAEPRIRAVLAIDPVDSAGLGAPLLARSEVGRLRLQDQAPIGLLGQTTGQLPLGEARPCTPSGQDHAALYAAAAAPAFSITFIDAGHGDFTEDPARCVPCRSCARGQAPPARTRDLTTRYATAYFLWTLKKQEQAHPFLFGPAFAADASTGAVQKEEK